MEALKVQVAEIPNLTLGLEEAQAENKRVLSVTKQVSRRLSVSRRANEQKMTSLIKSGVNWTEDSAHLACSHAATLNDEEFELEEESDIVKPKNKSFNFMKKVEDTLDKGDSIQMERFSEFKRLILEQMKPTIKRKIEARGEKRGPETEKLENAQSKPRITSPPKL